MKITAVEQLARIELDRWQRRARRWQSFKTGVKGFLETLGISAVIVFIGLLVIGSIGGSLYLYERRHPQPRVDNFPAVALWFNGVPPTNLAFSSTVWSNSETYP